MVALPGSGMHAAMWIPPRIRNERRTPLPLNRNSAAPGGPAPPGWRRWAYSSVALLRAHLFERRVAATLLD